MQRATGHVSAILKGILFIGISVQTILGIVWICCNLPNIPQFGESLFYMQLSRILQCDEYTGVLYPLFLRIVGNNHYVVYILQLAAAYAAANRFLSMFMQVKGLRKIWGNLAFLTMPTVMQCHAAVLPCSFASSLLLLELTLLIDGVRDGEKLTLKRMTELVLCWLALALLLPEYLYFGAVPVLLFYMFSRRKRKEQRRKAYGLLLAAVLLGMIIGIDSLIPQTEGMYGKLKKTPLMTLTQRISWTSLLAEFENWPEQLTYYANIYTVEAAALYADTMDRVFFSSIEHFVEEQEISAEQAREYYKILTKSAWDHHKTAILKEMAWDILGYGFSPITLQSLLAGRGYDSYTGTNYEIFLDYTPKLSKLYMDYGCWWFAVMLVLAGILQVIRLSGNTFKAMENAGKCVLCCLFTAGVMIVWYTMRGAGMMDYKNTILIDELWMSWAVLMFCHGADAKFDKIKDMGRDLNSEHST